MNGKQYSAAIQLSTEQALKLGQVSLQEIIGTLQLAIINAERICYHEHVRQQLEQQRLHEAGLEKTPGGLLAPKFQA